ncbi:diguanylate cyclase [bacterium]|nr:diguanylate cyclase [bacterium]
MQISIFKIFKYTKSLILLMLLLTILLSATILSEYSSFYKLENLQKQKDLATEIFTLGRSSIELTNIQFQGDSTLLKHEPDELSDLYDYDYISRLLQTGNYQNNILKLTDAINSFCDAAGKWYTQQQLEDEALQLRKEHFTQTYTLLMEQINTIISDNAKNEQKRFYLQEFTVLALLVLIVLSYFWINSRLALIKNDIQNLYENDNEETTDFISVEADIIARRICRTAKTPTASNPAFLDALTGINNYKGFIREFGDKKSYKLNNYTGVCIFSIDKLHDMELQYSQAFIETILKKVGFMLTLYRQHNDVIGRLDHNQFAIIVSRQDKSSAINDCELIRKSVQESPFTTSDGQSLIVTLSGGFVQKMSSQTLDEMITKANKVMLVSIQHGGNRIAQLRDEHSSMK